MSVPILTLANNGTYSKEGNADVVVEIDKKNATATVDGQNVNIDNCIEGGLK